MKRVAKIAGISLAVLLILLVAAYLFVSSSFFVRRIALPMVSAKTGWSITAGRARFSPFRSLILNDVVATPPEDGLAMVATEVECRYSAMRILRGKPTVHTLHIADATLHASQTAPAPGRAAFDLTLDGLQLTLHSVAPGAQATFEVTSDVRLTGPDLDVPRGRLSGKGTVTLGPDARPTHAQADIDLDRLAGRLRDLDLAQHALTIHAAIRSEAPLWRVDELVADITQAGALAARLTATGTVGQNPATADLSLAASPVTAGFLDLLGGLGGGYRFGQTALEYAGRLQLAADAAVTTDGTLALRELTVRSPDGKLPELPPVGVSFRHQASYSKAEGRLSVQALDAQIEQGGAEVLRLKASEPFTLVAGGSAPGTAAAGTPVQIRLDAKDFPLALISPLLPSSAGSPSAAAPSAGPSPSRRATTGARFRSRAT